MSLEFQVQQIQIPMRSSFKHASAERKVSDSVWVEARRGQVLGLGEGCPRPYVTGENTPEAINWIEKISQQLKDGIQNLEDLKEFVQKNKAAIDQNPSAWCALEISLLDLLAREKSISLENLLGLPELKGPFQYSAVVSDEKPEKFQKLLSGYFEMGFWDFKFKISECFEADQDKFNLFLKLSQAKNISDKVRLRLDGNNVWAGRRPEALQYLKKVPVPLFGVEEPLAPRDVEGQSVLSQELGCAIILDESLCREQDVDLYAKQKGTWVTNLRVSKVGGILRSLELVKKLKDSGIKIIVGAQVGETSVLSRAGLTVAQFAGDSLVAQEGAFGTLLLEKDTVSPVIMFGSAGLLKISENRERGLGLEKTFERTL